MDEAKDSVKKNRRTILVVDDEEDYRLTLERRLFQCGYDVVTAANGKHAIQKIQSGKQFNLILCDLKMPLVSGPDFLKVLRKAGIQVPVIVITGHPEKESVQSAAQFGVSAVLLKPFKPNDLMKKIEEVLAAHDSNATASTN